MKDKFLFILNMYVSVFVRKYSWVYVYVCLSHFHTFIQFYTPLYIYIYIYIFTQPLRSSRIWHKVNFLSGV